MDVLATKPIRRLIPGEFAATTTDISDKSFAFSNISTNRLQVSMSIARIAIYRKEGFCFRRFADLNRSNKIGRGYPFLVSGISGFIYSLMIVTVDQF